MINRRIATRLGAVALLFAVAAIGAAPANARFIPGVGEVSDCVPGARNCGKGGSKTQPLSPKERFVRTRVCRAKAAKAPFPEDRPMIFAVCMKG